MCLPTCRHLRARRPPRSHILAQACAGASAAARALSRHRLARARLRGIPHRCLAGFAQICAPQPRGRCADHRGRLAVHAPTPCSAQAASFIRRRCERVDARVDLWMAGCPCTRPFGPRAAVAALLLIGALASLDGPPALANRPWGGWIRGVVVVGMIRTQPAMPCMCTPAA